jgi:hypothetical protein
MTYFVDFVYWNYPDIVRLRKKKKKKQVEGDTYLAIKEKKRAKRAQSYWQQTQRGRSSAPF